MVINYTVTLNVGLSAFLADFALSLIQVRPRHMIISHPANLKEGQLLAFLALPLLLPLSPPQQIQLALYLRRHTEGRFV